MHTLQWRHPERPLGHVETDSGKSALLLGTAGVQLLWNMGWQLLTKLKQDPMILLLGVYQDTSPQNLVCE